jgi:hypothetical protein
MMGILFGGLSALAGLLPAGAQTSPRTAAAEEALRTRVWPRRLSLHVRAEPCDALTHQVSQQLMTRVKLESDIASRPLSLFASECTLAELRDGLAALFGYRLEPYDSAESVHLHLRAGAPPTISRRTVQGSRKVVLTAEAQRRGSRVLAAKRTAAGAGPRERKATKRTACQTRPSPSASSAALAKRAVQTPASGRGAADPKLREKLDLSAVEVDDEAEALPMILECLAGSASILVLSDYTPRTDGSPGGRPTSQFLASLNGLTLGEALDRTARAFNYSWSRSGRWFLFRSR